MKTSFANITVTPSRGATQLALQQPEEMMYLRNEITPETIAMLHNYKHLLALVVCWHKDNDGMDWTGIPSTDASLRHALAVAMKVTRAASKANRGQWALRKLKAERLLNRCADME